MRALIIALVVAGIAAGGVAAYLLMPQPAVCPPEAPGGFVSGPQVGAKMPGTFTPLNLNGADAGDECCVVCKYGNNPVAFVFATRTSDNLAALATRLERAVAESKTEKVGACIVVTDTSDSAKAALKQLADREKLQHVVLAVIDGKELKHYALNPDAEVTVVEATKMEVRGNRAVRTEEFTPSVVDAIAAEASQHFAAK